MNELQPVDLMEVVVAEHQLGEPDAYRRATHNSGNDVFVGDTHVVKLYSAEKSGASRIEADLCRALQGQLPVPGVVASASIDDRIYTVMKRLPGQPLELSWQTTPEADKAVLFGHMGSLLAKVHASSAEQIAGILEVPEQSIQTQLNLRASKALSTIAAQELLEPQAISSLRAYFAEHIPAMDRQEVGLRHGCFRFGNILAEGTRLTGLLDWEDATLGDTYEELAITMYRTVPPAYQKAFMDGYGPSTRTEVSNLAYPLLYYLKFLPDISTWTQFPGKQAYYRQATAQILKETIGE